MLNNAAAGPCSTSGSLKHGQHARARQAAGQPKCQLPQTSTLILCALAAEVRGFAYSARQQIQGRLTCQHNALPGVPPPPPPPHTHTVQHRAVHSPIQQEALWVHLLSSAASATTLTGRSSPSKVACRMSLAVRSMPYRFSSPAGETHAHSTGSGQHGSTAQQVLPYQGCTFVLQEHRQQELEAARVGGSKGWRQHGSATYVGTVRLCVSCAGRPAQNHRPHPPGALGQHQGHTCGVLKGEGE